MLRGRACSRHRMLKLFTISYGFLSVLGWTGSKKKKKKHLLTEERRSSSRPESRTGGQRWGDLRGPGKALATLDCDDRLLHRELVLLPSGRSQRGPNGPNSPPCVCTAVNRGLNRGVCFIFMYWPYLSIYPSVLYFLHCELWLIHGLKHLTDGQDTDMYHQLLRPGRTCCCCCRRNPGQSSSGGWKGRSSTKNLWFYSSSSPPNPARGLLSPSERLRHIQLSRNI